ncbi:MAG: septum formation inhibitor Maf [Gammaproteobacteria bacterium]|nr:septum formation inhibitor Maf [Gammaproteobacteria bacterium]
MSYDSIRLASASPRRSLLLRQIGVAHAVAAVDVDETRLPPETPAEHVLRLARAKARAGACADLPVLAADTAVALGGELFGKPVDEADAVRILGALAGRCHEVFTAVAVECPGRVSTALSVSRVWFRPITADECRRYWATGEPAGKAGGYAIQGFAAVFVERLEGSYSGVMGLPLYETAALLDGAGVRRWSTSP